MTTTEAEDQHCQEKWGFKPMRKKQLIELLASFPDDQVIDCGSIFIGIEHDPGTEKTPGAVWLLFHKHTHTMRRSA